MVCAGPSLNCEPKLPVEVQNHVKAGTCAGKRACVCVMGGGDRELYGTHNVQFPGRWWWWQGCVPVHGTQRQAGSSRWQAVQCAVRQAENGVQVCRQNGQVDERGRDMVERNGRTSSRRYGSRTGDVHACSRW